MSLLTAKRWGWGDKSLSYRQRAQIALAATTQVSYNSGYFDVFTHNQLQLWDDRVNNYKSTGDGEMSQCLDTKHKGSISLVEK